MNSVDEHECDSCTLPTRVEDLVEVRRALYYGMEESTPLVQDDVEHWCSGCRATYPNVLVDECESGSS